MRKFVLVLVLATIVLGPSAFPADGDQQNQQNTTHNTAASYAHGSAMAYGTTPRGHEHSATSNHDQVALADMHDYLLRHLGNAHVEPHTFGKADDWSHDWELRWIDYHGNEGHLRIYHATHKRDARQRYTMYSDPHHPHERTWHLVR